MGLIEFALQICRKHAVNVSLLPRYLVIMFVLPDTRVEYAGKEQANTEHVVLSSAN